MGGGEFVEWMAFNELAPFDHTRRIEVMLAQFMAHFMNVNRAKNSRQFKYVEFLPEYKQKEAEADGQNEAQMMWAWEMWYRALGGKDS